MIKTLENNNITLIELKKRIKYLRQIFDNSKTSTTKSFKKIVNNAEFKLYKMIIINTLLNEHVKGTLLKIEIKRISSNENVKL